MTSRRVTIKLAIAALAAGLILIVLLLPAPREPVHQGKPLTEWLGGFDHNYESTNYSASRAAIRAMGTNALPFLIRYLRAKDPPYYAQWVRLKAKLGLLRGPVDYAVFWHRRAANACVLLEADADAAFPAMMEAMNDPRAASDVGGALSRMFPKSAHVLTNILATGNVTARGSAAWALMTAYSHPAIEEMARTALLNALRDPEPGVRASAASAFQFWDKRFDVIVPALTRALSDSSPSVRGNSATSLGNFGSAAKQAVPELLKLLQDTNTYPGPSSLLSERAVQMLLKIDPKAAARAAGN